jgi:hypothetical protein
MLAKVPYPPFALSEADAEPPAGGPTRSATAEADFA